MTNRAALALSLLLSECLFGASPVRFEEIPPALLPFLPGAGDAARFEQFRKKLVRDMSDRLQAGERDALVYYVIQARRFTAQPPLEPVLSARDFFESGKIPDSVSARILDFLRACRAPGSDERLQYFCGMTGVRDRLPGEFERAMRFLYEKEFLARDREGDERRERVASLYRTRGLSSDSVMDANFPVYLALKKLALDRTLRLDNILIVGPDFAPRTGLNDSIPPQSLQPFAIADAALQLGLSTPSRLRIHCVDINPRVVDHLRRARATAPALVIPKRAGPAEYNTYYEQFGRAIGKAGRAGPDSRTVHVSAEVAGMVSADRLDVVTERADPTPPYDLVVATNVLVYLSDAEMALAMFNIRSMLREGGYFVHNESRDSVEAVGRALKMPVVDAKLIRLLESDRRAIYDTQVVHRKAAERIMK